VLNAVFLHECVQAGLDFAIVNAEKLARYASIPKEEIVLAQAVLFSGPEESRSAVEVFTAHFRGKSAIKKPLLSERELRRSESPKMWWTVPKRG
jgi:5-methyltetrahydrofolate--homocysteine methyltransferase